MSATKASGTDSELLLLGAALINLYTCSLCQVVSIEWIRVQCELLLGFAGDNLVLFGGNEWRSFE